MLNLLSLGATIGGSLRTGGRWAGERAPRCALGEAGAARSRPVQSTAGGTADHRYRIAGGPAPISKGPQFAAGSVATAGRPDRVLPADGMQPHFAEAAAMSNEWIDADDDRAYYQSLSLTPGARYFDNVGSTFRSLDMDTAADNLARYRSGRGGTYVFSNEEIERHSPLLRYEDENRTAFESFTFVGENRRGVATGALQNLADGESVTYGDYFNPPQIPHRLSTYMAFGRTGVLSRFEGTATRRGDEIQIEGEVSHDFSGGNGRPGELFDFNPGQPGHSSAVEAETAGEARPFEMRMDRRQTVSALTRREPNGLFTLQSATWGPIR